MFDSVVKTSGYIWAAPNTLLGLTLLPLALVTGGRVRLERGAIEIYAGAPGWILRRWARASALTLGHVIVGQDRDVLDHSRDHEHVHIRQYACWGPLMLPA